MPGYTDLPEQEFRAQTEKLRRVASYDNATRSWYGQIPFDRPVMRLTHRASRTRNRAAARWLADSQRASLEI